MEKHEVAQAGIYLEALKEITLPLPSLATQNRLVEVLDRADKLRRARRYVHQIGEPLLQTVFLRTFGDTVTNPLNLPIDELGDHLSFVTSGSRGWAEYYAPSGARFIRSLDVRMNHIADEEAVYVTPPSGAEADRARVRLGDVLLTITGSRIGRVAPVPQRLAGAYISQHVAILRLSDRLLPEFVSIYLSLETGGQREIARVQYGQTKPGLNLDQIRELHIPVPEIALQRRFVALIDRVERLNAKQREGLRLAEHLFDTLLFRTFSQTDH